MDDNNKQSDINFKSTIISQMEKENAEIEDEIAINDNLRNILFYLFCIIYCISSVDGGIIPQQNKNIQKDFGDEYGESRVGLFGSIDYIGRIIGAIVMSALINKFDRRILYSLSCFFKAINCFIPLFTKNYYANIFARLLSGIP